jgi:hypothetical protein
VTPVATEPAKEGAGTEAISDSRSVPRPHMSGAAAARCVARSPRGAVADFADRPRRQYALVDMHRPEERDL